MHEWAPEALAIFNGRIDKNVMSGGEEDEEKECVYGGVYP